MPIFVIEYALCTGVGCPNPSRQSQKRRVCAKCKRNRKRRRPCSHAVFHFKGNANNSQKNHLRQTEPERPIAFEGSARFLKANLVE